MCYTSIQSDYCGVFHLPCIDTDTILQCNGSIQLIMLSWLALAGNIGTNTVLSLLMQGDIFSFMIQSVVHKTITGDTGQFNQWGNLQVMSSEWSIHAGGQWSCNH